MEPESSLPYSQVPATCPYPDPTPSSPHNPLPTSWRSILILSSHLQTVITSQLTLYIWVKDVNFKYTVKYHNAFR
jgi:hypothetical protein